MLSTINSSYLFIVGRQREMKLKIGILGYGEIGSSLSKLYDEEKYNLVIKDLDRDDDLSDLDVLNICIPFKNSDQFVKAVCNQIIESSPSITIIHSTTLPGTTNIISDVTESNVVHSPVRGVHPNLTEGIKTFVKFIGSDNLEASSLTEEHFKELGIRTKTCSSSRTTELGKLLSTTYYGVVIAWHGEMQNICEEMGVSFDESVTLFNETYNEGYAKLGKEDVIRPTLYPPDGNIGGHCIIPNAKLLDSITLSDAIKLVIKYGAT